LAGSIDVPGGVTVFREFSLLESEDDVDEIAAHGLSRSPLDGPTAKRRLSDSAVDLLADSINNGREYPTAALFLVDADPVFASAEGERFGAALSSVPFVVSLSGYHNDSNRHADLILPSLHSMYRWDFNIAHTLKGHPVVTVSQPAMNPPPGMRDPYDVLRAVAVQLGGTVAKALPWSDSKQAMEAVCRDLFQAGRGAAFGPASEESWAQLLESRGWRAPFAENFKDFRQAVLAGGGWTDPIYFHREWERVFRAPRGKFAFSSAYLARSFEAFPGPQGSSHRDRLCLPNCRKTKQRRDKTYPLDLYVYLLPNLVAVSSPNLPWLNDIAGAYMFEKWRTWVEIHPKTAEHFGLSGNDQVEVRTPSGKLVLPVKIYSGLMPDVIAIPFGFGHRVGGRWCAGVGRNPAELVDTRTDPLTGKSLWSSTRATVRKI
jgi:anaerobic selenocysteine-containing dehydrogenase